MMVERGVWIGPYMDLAQCVLGPHVSYGRVRLWRCPDCGRFYHHAEPIWESKEREVALDRVEELLVLPLYDLDIASSRSGLHYVHSTRVQPFVVSGMRFIPRDLFGSLNQDRFVIATFGSPFPFYHELTLAADQERSVEVEARICPRCYARGFSEDPSAVKVGMHLFRPNILPRIHSPFQGGVEVLDPSKLWSFEVRSGGDVEVFLRRYRWGQLGVIHTLKPPIVVKDVEFGPDYNYVEFTNDCIS